MIPFGYRQILKSGTEGIVRAYRAESKELKICPREPETWYNCCTYLRSGIINELLMSDASDTS